MEENTKEVRNVKVLPSSKYSAFEYVEVNSRLGIRMKSHYIPLRCDYCGSRNISDYTCNQCGAPTK